MNYIVTGNSITVLIDNKPEIIDNTHPNFEKVENAIKAGTTEVELKRLMNVSAAVIDFGEGKVQVENGEITYDGEAVHSSLSTRILSLMDRGFDITPFTNFMENLYQNPSKSAVDELYGFLEACELPITEDGCFLAYKKITIDYLDCYTRTIDNSIGSKPSMPRYKVNEDSEQTCSTGLHVASYSYMSAYGGDRIVICKVHPKDVVAVPNDYNNAKMRVCEYEVVNEVAVTNEEIDSNVISDDEAYSDEYVEATSETTTEQPHSYEDDNAPEFDSYEEITKFVDERNLYQLREVFEAWSVASNQLAKYTNSTYMWKRDFIDFLVDFYGTEVPSEPTFTVEPQTDIEVDKPKFGEQMKAFLGTYDLSKWNKLSAYLIVKDINVVGLIQTCYDLEDVEAIVNKLKSLAKDGSFKKKDMLYKLGL